MIRKYFFLALFFACTAWYGYGQQHAAQAITSNQYREDFALLRKSFEQSYPSLYRFRDKPAINRLFDSCYARITTETTQEDFYRTVKYLLSVMGDGHLSVSPSPELRSTFENQGYFPLSLVFLNTDVYAFCDNAAIPKGSRILSIDGVPMQTVKEKVYNYLVADGNITSSKDWMLNTSFWFNYYLAYGKKENFSVRYAAPDGKAYSTSLNAVTRSNICPGYSFTSNTQLLDITFPNNQLALMTIKTFSYQSLQEANLDFGNFLDSAFKAINAKNITRLIIDLRGNGGGADVYGSYLYSWLTRKPFKYYKELVTSVRKLSEADHPNLKLQQPNDVTYDGEVVFLINGLTFSAAAEFCSVAKSNNRGRFVGEETGGGYFGNTSGNSASTLLPNTGITVFIPTTKYVMDVRGVQPNNRGVMPDYPVFPSISAIFQNRDAQLQKAIELLMPKKNTAR